MQHIVARQTFAISYFLQRSKTPTQLPKHFLDVSQVPILTMYLQPTTSLQPNASAAVPTHFNLPDHSLADMRLIPLESQSSKKVARRRARKAYFIEKGRTLSPHGLTVVMQTS